MRENPSKSCACISPRKRCGTFDLLSRIFNQTARMCRRVCILTSVPDYRHLIERRAGATPPILLHPAPSRLICGTRSIAVRVNMRLFAQHQIPANFWVREKPRSDGGGGGGGDVLSPNIRSKRKGLLFARGSRVRFPCRFSVKWIIAF